MKIHSEKISSQSKILILISLEINIRDLGVYKVDFSEKNHDFLIYRIKVENFRRILYLRSPYVIQNQTLRAYKLKFFSLNGYEQRSILLKSGQTYPL